MVHRLLPWQSWEWAERYEIIPLCEETEPVSGFWPGCWCVAFFDMTDCTSACEYGCTDPTSSFYNPMANNMCCGCCYQNPQQGATRRMGGEIERSSMVRPRPRPNRRFTKPNTAVPLLPPDTRDSSCLAKGDIITSGGQYAMELKHCFDFDCADLNESQVEAWVSSCACNNAWGNNWPCGNLACGTYFVNNYTEGSNTFYCDGPPTDNLQGTVRRAGGLI